MKYLLLKEIKLSASILTFLFLGFAFMTMIPGYPILLGAFFICFGVFQSFQNSRENNDILYTVLLPIRKKDAVLAKYIFVCFIQMIGFLLMLILTVVRMQFLSETAVYVNNPLLNANPFFLFGVLLIFGLFDVIFIPGFFKTAYKFGKPFILFIILSMLTVGVMETMHHIPGLTVLNSTTGEELWRWFIAGILIYVVCVFTGLKLSQNRFEKVDM